MVDNLLLTMEPNKIWHRALEKIKEQVSLTNFRSWFGKTFPEKMDGETLVICTPSAFIAEQLKVRYLGLIKTVLEQESGQKLNVEFKVDAGKFTKVVKHKEEDLFDRQYPRLNNTLNPRYTLANFVVGLSNNVAYAAAQAVVQNPGLSYNPLLV